MLLYGNDVLKNCVKYIRHVPFHFYPRIYEWIDFGLNISEIPLETRLGINIYVVSN